ncbi:MAG: 2-oxo acid dehydrogenase subunit E2 [Sandaracinaceae bacterium]
MPLFRRFDGEVVKTNDTRAIMPYIIPTRAGAQVEFEQELDVTRAMAFCEARNAARAKGQKKVGLFHIYTYAVVQTLKQRPRLNRFTNGGHLYQRREIEIGFSAKKSMSDDASMVAVKRRFDRDADFEGHLDRLAGGINEGRSSEKNQTDKELSVFLKLPAPLLRRLVALALWLESWNLLPRAMIESDPLYCSLFVANLGSVGLDAVHHHLYEWGNCPIFAAIGRIRDEGERKVCTVKYTFDERIEDGLYCARSLERLQRMIEEWDG